MGELSGGGYTIKSVRNSCKEINGDCRGGAGIELNTSWWDSETDRRRPLDTGPAISGDFGSEVTFADPLPITMGRECSGSC